MNGEQVTIALELLLKELERVVTDINNHGAILFKENAHPALENVLATSKKLSAFRQKCADLQLEWQRDFNDMYPTTGTILPPPALLHDAVIPVMSSLPPRKKAPKSRLIVKYADGSVIYEQVAARTFLRALQRFGLSRVMALGIEVGQVPLVSKQCVDTTQQTPVDDYFVVTRSSTKRKYELLQQIATTLRESIRIDIVPT